MKGDCRVYQPRIVCECNDFFLSLIKESPEKNSGKLGGILIPSAREGLRQKRRSREAKAPS